MVFDILGVELQLLWGKSNKDIEIQFDYVGLGELDRSYSFCENMWKLSPGILSGLSAIDSC